MTGYQRGVPRVEGERGGGGRVRPISSADRTAVTWKLQSWPSMMKGLRKVSGIFCIHAALKDMAMSQLEIYGFLGFPPVMHFNWKPCVRVSAASCTQPIFKQPKQGMSCHYNGRSPPPPPRPFATPCTSALLFRSGPAPHNSEYPHEEKKNSLN